MSARSPQRPGLEILSLGTSGLFNTENLCFKVLGVKSFDLSNNINPKSIRESKQGAARIKLYPYFTILNILRK